MNDSAPRYLEDILKFYHQSRTDYSHQGIIYALKNQILTWKLMASKRFPLLPPNYGTSSPLKFELVVMLIFLNLSWKRFFLNRHMTFSFIIFVFVSFLFIKDVYAINFPICTVVFYVSLWLLIFLCPCLHCKVLWTAMYKCYIIPLLLLLLVVVVVVVVVVAVVVVVVILFFTCPMGKWRFLRNSNYRKTVKSILLIKMFLGLVEMMFGLVYF